MLNEDVLVLNKHFLAIKVTTAREALCSLVAGRAQVIDKQYCTYRYNNWVIQTNHLILTDEIKDYPGIVHSPSVQIAIPQVIIVPTCDFFAQDSQAIRFSRKNIFQRDRYICQYCRSKFDRRDLTLDHLIPRSRGGSTTWTNIVTCCIKCNMAKGNQTIEELGWSLLNNPSIPKWKSYIGKPFNKIKKDYWEKFLK